MGRLAWKNLVYDRVRLMVTLSGIVFALVLIVVQFGLFLGFLDMAANVVANNRADIWVAAPGIPHVNGGAPIPETRRYQALESPGVARVEKYALWFASWKLPRGSQESVQVIGFDLDSKMGGPWNLTAGSIEDLRAENTVIIDELYAKRLGVQGLGHVAELNDRRARVVGFTKGIRSFTTSPYVFTSFKNALGYCRLTQDQTVFLLVKAQPGVDVQALRSNLERRVPGVEVFTKGEMQRKTENFWLFRTAAGTTTLMGAALGLLVGMVVVAQTIYATTMERIREFGTLKAMGAANSVIYRVIIQQALMSAAMGYSLAIAVGWFVSRQSRNQNVAIPLTGEMALGLLGVAVLMCVSASVISIRKATRIDPALVFKG